MKLKLSILFLTVIAVFYACKPVEEVVNETSEELLRVVGTVSIDENCGTIISVTQGDVIRYYSPTNLEAKFAKEGMKLRFNAKVSSKKMDGDCSFYALMEVNEVSAVR